MRELQTICLAGGVSHSASLWNAGLWTWRISHIDKETHQPEVGWILTVRAMKSPVAYGNPVMFSPVNWTQAAGVPLRRGKSVEELGDAGWARERERMVHLQQLQQLYQLQLQQQQVGYPGYGAAPAGQPQRPVLVTPAPSPAPACPMPVPGAMMVPVGGPVPPPGHGSAQWPVQWSNQIQVRPDNVVQPHWEHDDQQKAAYRDARNPGQNVYFHPRSEDGHLDLRISEWKGKHCFYQGPDDYNRVPQERENFNTQEDYGTQDKKRRGRDDWDRENEQNSEHYDHQRHRNLKEYDYNDKYRGRDHYDRKYNEEYDGRGRKYQETRRHKHDYREYDSYDTEYEDNYDHQDTYPQRNNYRDRDYNEDRDYYDSKEQRDFREKHRNRQREEDCYYNERRAKDHRLDHRAEDRYDRREYNYKHRDDHDPRVEETRRSKGRGQYDSEVEEHWDYRENDRRYRYKDSKDDRRGDYFNHNRREYDERDDYEQRSADYYDHEYEDHYESREGERSRHRRRDQIRDLRSISMESDYDNPTRDQKTHCEKWVEQQNKNFAPQAMLSFEDPIVYQHDDDQEKGYESSASSKLARKPVYVGSLDRNSFYRKTAPSSLRNSQFATTRKQKKGKHKSSM